MRIGTSLLRNAKEKGRRLPYLGQDIVYAAADLKVEMQGPPGWFSRALDSFGALGAAVDHHGVSVGPPRCPSPDRSNSAISSLTSGKRP